VESFRGSPEDFTMSNGDRLPLHPVRILSVPLGALVTVRFLGGIRGMPTHYHNRHTVPCRGDKDCPPASHKLRAVWKYYGAVEVWLNGPACWRPAVLEATEHLEEQLHGRDLRGEVWMLTREGSSSKRSILTGTFCERLSDVQLSLEFDVEQILLRFFRVESLLLGTPSPVPPRLFLSDVRGKPPVIPDDLRPPTPHEAAENRKAFKSLVEEFAKRGNLSTGQTAADPSSNGKGEQQ
jgi:hypothetical protein